MLTQEKAIEVLKKLLPPPSAFINIIRIDHGRHGAKRYYAVLCVNPLSGRIENISNFVAKAIGCKWSGHTWPNASAVYYSGSHDLYLAIAYKLHGHNTIRELEKLLVFDGEL
jgi:hypothetical protein